jgi:hypothetical protein
MVAARTVVAGECLNGLDGVHEFADVGTFGDAINVSQRVFHSEAIAKVQV